MIRFQRKKMKKIIQIIKLKNVEKKWKNITYLQNKTQMTTKLWEMRHERNEKYNPKNTAIHLQTKIVEKKVEYMEIVVNIKS
jgi:hypothetical protein